MPGGEAAGPERGEDPSASSRVTRSHATSTLERPRSVRVVDAQIVALITMAAMAAPGVRSGSLLFTRFRRGRCKRQVSAHPSEPARTPASICHAEGRGFESHHPLQGKPRKRGFLVGSGCPLRDRCHSTLEPLWNRALAHGAGTRFPCVDESVVRVRTRSPTTHPREKARVRRSSQGGRACVLCRPLRRGGRGLPSLMRRAAAAAFVSGQPNGWSRRSLPLP